MESDGRLVTKTPTRGPWLLGRVFLGFPVCALLAYGTGSLIVRAWAACDDAEPPYVAALVFLVLPVIALADWLVWVLGAFLTRTRPWPVFLTVSICFVGLVGLGAFAMNVPAHDPSFYAEYGEGDFVQGDCYPDGRPKWWPLWLPG